MVVVCELALHFTAKDKFGVRDPGMLVYRQDGHDTVGEGNEYEYCGSDGLSGALQEITVDYEFVEIEQRLLLLREF
jgi:hypothetical protein